MRKYKLLRDGQVILSEVPGKYAGHRAYKIFGRLDCKSGMRMKKENRVFFQDIEDAVRQGYRPCRNCCPLDEEGFVKIKNLSGFESLRDFYFSGKKFS